MIARLFAAWCLMALCVCVYAGGLTWALRQRPEPPQGFWPGTWLVILVAAWVVLLRLVEITVWAVPMASTMS